MKQIKKSFSGLKNIVSDKIKKIKKQSQKIKENFEEAKNKPRSKRKSYFLGIATVLSIFGISLVIPVSSTVAKDIPPKPGSNQISPSSQLSPSKEIIKAISGTAASVCALAVTSGSFVVGAACGVVVVFGILKAQGK